jgi:hypothetical protein
LKKEGKFFFLKKKRGRNRGSFGHPQAFGGGLATPKGHKKKKQKKNKKQNEFELLGVAEPPPRAWGWPKPPPTAQTLFFFFDGLLGWPDHPQRPGVASATPYRPYGVAEATPWPKMGWSGHPIFGQGATPISSPFLF